MLKNCEEVITRAHSGLTAPNCIQGTINDCKALIDADGIVISLARLLSLAPSNDLMTATLTHLEKRSRAILLLDNLDTVWLNGGEQGAVFDEVLGPDPDAVTCRGIHLP